MEAVNQKGFTLVEIIAVLVILGILAAVTIPKYLSMADDARSKAAQGAIAEVKSKLASAQARYIMSTQGTAPTSAQLYTYAVGPNGYGNAANLANVGTDFNVTVTSATPINIVVSAVQNTNLTTNAVGNFRAAGDP
jgi:MSHA pilin protein MshA